MNPYLLAIRQSQARCKKVEAFMKKNVCGLADAYKACFPKEHGSSLS